MEYKLHSFNELDYFFEKFHRKSGEFLFTTCILIDRENTVHIACVPKTQRKLCIDDVEERLEQIPDTDIYEKVPTDKPLTLAPKRFSGTVYIKRPSMTYYPEFKEQGVLRIISEQLIIEARNAERLSELPEHPGILRYHGCITNRGFITGIVYDKQICDLNDYIASREEPPIDKDQFMSNITWVVEHLHSAGIAHNDITPYNILVDDAGQPVLGDFDSCCPFGEPLSTRQGTPGWIEKSREEYTTSEAQHDLYALKKLKAWLDERL